MTPQTDILVVGAGNEYMGDDGAGCEVVAALERTAHPHLDTFQCGTDLFRLASIETYYPHVIIIDAVTAGDPLGSIHWFAPHHARHFRVSGSVHQLSLLEIISLLPLMNALLESTVFSLVGIEPGPIHFEQRLSPPVVTAVQAIFRELDSREGAAAVIEKCQQFTEVSPDRRS